MLNILCGFHSVKFYLITNLSKREMANWLSLPRVNTKGINTEPADSNK